LPPELIIDSDIFRYYCNAKSKPAVLFLVLVYRIKLLVN
jgi:hypothetical protein